MEVVTRSFSKIFAESKIKRAFYSSRAQYRPPIRLIRSPNPSSDLSLTGNSGRLIFLQKRPISLVSSHSLLEESEAEVDTVDVGDQATPTLADQFETVCVKIVLEKSCKYGEKFLLVGGDSTLGSWDPSKAVPLEWSDGDVWTVTLEVPAGKTIEFKLVLEGRKGEVEWQRGPDRILQTWVTKNTIVVTEDWDDAEIQRITEVEPLFEGKETETTEEELMFKGQNFEITEGTMFDGKKHDITEEEPMFVGKKSEVTEEEPMVVGKKPEMTEEEPMFDGKKREMTEVEQKIIKDGKHLVLGSYGGATTTDLDIQEQVFPKKVENALAAGASTGIGGQESNKSEVTA